MLAALYEGAEALPEICGAGSAPAAAVRKNAAATAAANVRNCLKTDKAFTKTIFVVRGGNANIPLSIQEIRNYCTGTKTLACVWTPSTMATSA